MAIFFLLGAKLIKKNIKLTLARLKKIHPEGFKTHKLVKRDEQVWFANNSRVAQKVLERKGAN